jgi:flavin-dependent dehydrogenase
VEQNADRVCAGGIEARYLVAADGLHSAIRRACGLEPPPARRPRYGLRRHFRVAPWTSMVEVYWSPQAEAYVTPVAEDLVGVAILGAGGRSGGVAAAGGRNHAGRPDRAGLPDRAGITGRAAHLGSAGLPGSAARSDRAGPPGSAVHLDSAGLPGSAAHLDSAGIPGSADFTDRTGGPGGFIDRLAAFPALVERLAGAEPAGRVRGAGPLRQDVPGRVRGRVLLVGDASGYLDALTGEGISVALAQAAALAQCLRDGRPGDYERAWRRAGRKSRLLTAGLLWSRHQPALARAIVPAAQRLPGLFTMIVNQVAG